MRQKVTLLFAALLMLFMSLPAAAKVTGLPDFTELVEKAGPAVVNIQVTQFGTRSSRKADENGEHATGVVKTTPRYRSFSGATLMCPATLVVVSRIVWEPVLGSYMMQRVTF